MQSSFVIFSITLQLNPALYETSVRLMNFRTVSHLDVITTGGSLGHVMAIYKLPREISSCTFQITAVSSYCKINDSSYTLCPQKSEPPKHFATATANLHRFK